MADRYCRNCGHELAHEDRFCAGCGRPVEQTAQVPTPEADVQVPSPPHQQSEVPGASSTQRPRSYGNWGNMVKLVATLVALGLLVAVVLPLVFASQENSGGGGTPGAAENAEQASEEQEGETPETQEGPGSGETFTKENYAELVANPDEYKGASVDIAGELLGNVEKDEDYVYFQMYADPANLEWNTIVRAPDTGLSLDGDDYVHITGTVVGSMEGENAFGGTVSAVQVEADSVEEIEAVEAVDPAQETAELDKTMTDQGFSITLQKIEFAENSTRLYVKLRNDTGAVANFYAFDSTIVQGSTQIDQETPFDYEVKEPQDTLSPGVESEGVLVFGPVDYSQPFNVTFEWSSDNYNITPRPIRLQLNP